MVIAERAVLVFDLDGNNRSTILDQERRDFPGEAREPFVHRRNVFGVGGTEFERAILKEPAWIAAELPLSAHVGPGTKNDVEAFLLSFANVFGNIVLPGEVVDAGPRLVDVPEDICGDGIEAHGAGLAETIAPVSARHA